MDKYFDILESVELFKGIERKNLSELFDCLQEKIENISKGEFVIRAGDKVEHVGIVLKGRLHIVKDDADGVRSLLAGLSPGDIFAEAICCAGLDESPVSVAADTDATVMLLDFKRVLRQCPNACAFHSKLVENMLKVIAVKNLRLQARMDILSKKSIRSRLLSYLETVPEDRSREFSIPFNRGGLADFLCVDRSALSRELSRLKQEGVVDYKKDRFRFLDE